MKIAVVLFNLGGPDSLDAVQPFLKNLFSDPAIISLPGFVRLPLARLIAARRAPLARQIYEHLGGKSPILEETEEQARALEAALASAGHQAKCFIAMRCWHPFTAAAVEAVNAYEPEEIVLLPLYPQYSTTTTKSSLAEWRKRASRANLRIPQHEVCCYPFEPGFIEAIADLTRNGLAKRKTGLDYRVLFSAHGLPKRVVERGDPYQWQVERTVDAVLARFGPEVDWTICYQSRVGPLEWIGPATDAEIRRAGAEKKGLIVVPVAFVSEHSETLVELDIEYGVKLGQEVGVPDFIRVQTVRTHPAFIAALASLVTTALNAKTPVTCAPERICPTHCQCEHERRLANV